MFDDLRATPEVLWGAAIAFGIVVLLTPAVGGMARLLGVVDHPDARRVNKRPIPRLGGLAIFIGIVIPAIAFLDLSGEMRGVLLGAGVACVVGAVDDFRTLSPLPKLAGQVVAAAIPTAFGVWIDHFTFPFLGAVDVPGVARDPAHDPLDRRGDEHGQLPRRARRPRGRCLRDRRVHVRRHRALARQEPTRRSSRRSSQARASGSCGTTSSPRASSWATPARSCSGTRSPTISVAGLLKTASTVVLFLPAARPRDPDHRHLVRRRAAAEARPAGLCARTSRTSITASSRSASASVALR